MRGPRHRRRRATVAIATAGALLLTACGGDPAPTPGPEAAPTATDACAAGELPQLQAGSHLLGDTDPPVPYSSTPATSGWHTSGAVETGVLADPIDDPRVVAILEQGGVVALYDPATAEAGDVRALRGLGEDTHAGRLSVAPYAGELDAPIVLAAWGVLQRCDALDPDAVATFVLRYHGAVTSH